MATGTSDSTHSGRGIRETEDQVVVAEYIDTIDLGRGKTELGDLLRLRVGEAGRIQARKYRGRGGGGCRREENAGKDGGREHGKVKGLERKEDKKGGEKKGEEREREKTLGREV